MKNRIPAYYIGHQERFDGLPFALVNLPSGTTVAYDPAEHEIANPADYEAGLDALICRVQDDDLELYELARVPASDTPFDLAQNVNDLLAVMTMVQGR